MTTTSLVLSRFGDNLHPHLAAPWRTRLYQFFEVGDESRTNCFTGDAYFIGEVHMYLLSVRRKNKVVVK